MQGAAGCGFTTIELGVVLPAFTTTPVGRMWIGFNTGDATAASCMLPEASTKLIRFDGSGARGITTPVTMIGVPRTGPVSEVT